MACRRRETGTSAYSSVGPSWNYAVASQVPLHPTQSRDRHQEPSREKGAKLRVALRATLKRKAKEMADQTRRQGSKDVGTIAAARDTAATFHKWAREHDQDAALHNGDCCYRHRWN